MPRFIRNPSNFLSGVVFLGIGLVFVYLAQDYRLGSARQMGPGYFPTVLGGLLATLGAVLVVISVSGLRGRLERVAWRPLVMAVTSLIAFGVLVRGAGLMPAVGVLVIVSLTASIRFRFATALVLAVSLAIFSWAVFSRGLGLPLPALGAWFGS